ncbi:unnamed protein product [Moneuplotes crassus]|uniref:Uncharacterized protein n=1 Tax=Euplotes crassus TaxID=5936 RepID=A0AAD1XLJ4_EUPCR|nr:unnamed protein product [Moneuplotes crassus]
MNTFLVSDRTIVIDPISGRAILGKNSLQDRKSVDYKEDRLRQFMRDRRMTSHSQLKATRNMVVCKNIMSSPSLRNSQHKFQSYGNADANTSENLPSLKFNNNSRNISTEDIEGASPKKFRHKNKKLFIDRKEILSVLGGSPGRYHGFKKDQKVGGTFSNANNFWDERGILDKKFAAGARLPQKNFQSKRKVHIPVNQSYGFEDHSKTFEINKSFGHQNSIQVTSKALKKKVINDLKKYKDRASEMLPNLRESVSNPNLQNHKASPYKNGDNIKSLNKSILKESNIATSAPKMRLNKSISSPYSRVRIKLGKKSSGSAPYV